MTLQLKVVIYFIWFAALLYITSSSHCLAADQFFNNHEEGWFWYKEQLKKDPHTKDKQPQTPLEKLETYKKHLETLKAIAVLSPSVKNIENYIKAQKEFFDRSEKFAHLWQVAVFSNPSLDYSIKHPTNSIARQIWLQEDREKKEKKIRELAKTHGLFFFFRRNCRYCHRFSAIVKNFSEKYGWKVVPISLDGEGLPEYPHPLKNKGQAEKLGIEYYPTLIAVEPKSGKVIPLAFGLVAEDEIEQRIEKLK